MIIRCLIQPDLRISELQFATDYHWDYWDYLQNDIKANGNEEGDDEPDSRHENVVPEADWELGLALETETEDWEEAEDQAADDHGLVVLEIPHSQHRHHEGGEYLADQVFVNQSNRGEAEQDEDLEPVGADAYELTDWAAAKE